MARYILAAVEFRPGVRNIRETIILQRHQQHEAGANSSQSLLDYAVNVRPALQSITAGATTQIEKQQKGREHNIREARTTQTM